MHAAALRLALVYAVARPGGRAMLLSADNLRDGHAPLPDAVQSGGAFFVEIADDVLAVDQDDPGHAAALDALAMKLRDHGILPVIVASGGDGRRHLFAHVPSRPLRLELSAHAKAAGLDVRRSIRPPLTPHRLGLPVRLLEPLDARAALARLAREPARRRWLSPRIVQLLRHGDVHERYKSTSEVAMAIALGAVNRGCTEQTLHKMLVNPRNQGGAKVQKVL